MNQKDIKIIYPLRYTLYSRVYVLETRKKKYIVKARLDNFFKREHRAFEFLTSAKFPYMPRFYGVKFIEGARCIILEYLQGEEVKRGTYGSYLHYLPLVAKSIGKLHCIQKNFLSSTAYFIKKEIDNVFKALKINKYSCSKAGNLELLSYLYKIENYLRPSKDFIEKFKVLLKEKIKPSFVNREPEFIVVKKRKACFVDWEHSGFGDAACDLAYMGNHFTGFDLKVFLREYRKYIDISGSIYLRILLYQYIQLLEEVIYYIEDLNNCELYRQIPLRIMKSIYGYEIHGKFTDIEKIYTKLNSFKYPW